MNFKYAVFDMDGTLIDTNDMWEISERKAVGEHFGINLVSGKHSEFIYTGLSDMVRYACGITGKQLTVPDVLDKVYEYMQEYYDSAPIKPIDKAIEYLRFLKSKGIKTAIATATDYFRCGACLESLNIMEYIDIFISTSMVGKSKKHPDVFYKAIELLGGNKDEAIVFEDAAYSLSTLHSNGFRYGIIHDGLRSSMIEQEVKKGAEFYIQSYKELM